MSLCIDQISILLACHIYLIAARPWLSECRSYQDNDSVILHNASPQPITRRRGACGRKILAGLKICLPCWVLSATPIRICTAQDCVVLSQLTACINYMAYMHQVHTLTSSKLTSLSRSLRHSLPLTDQNKLIKQTHPILCFPRQPSRVKREANNCSFRHIIREWKSSHLCDQQAQIRRVRCPEPRSWERCNFRVFAL